MKPEGGPARDLDFDMGTEGQAAMTICHSDGSAAKCRWLDNHHAFSGFGAMLAECCPVAGSSDQIGRRRSDRRASLDLLAQLDGFAVVLFEEVWRSPAPAARACATARRSRAGARRSGRRAGSDSARGTRQGRAACRADRRVRRGSRCGISAVMRRVICRSIMSSWRCVCRRASSMRESCGRSGGRVMATPSPCQPTKLDGPA
jgi:hypothetical protein